MFHTAKEESKNKTGLAYNSCSFINSLDHLLVWLSNSRLRLRASYSCTKGGERSIRFGLLRNKITSPMSKVLIISTLRTGPLESSISDTELVILDISFSSYLVWCGPIACALRFNLLQDRLFGLRSPC